MMHLHPSAASSEQAHFEGQWEERRVAGARSGNEVEIWCRACLTTSSSWSLKNQQWRFCWKVATTRPDSSLNCRICKWEVRSCSWLRGCPAAHRAMLIQLVELHPATRASTLNPACASSVRRMLIMPLFSTVLSALMVEAFLVMSFEPLTKSSVVKVFQISLPFFAILKINPFLNSRISANHDKNMVFSQSWNPYTLWCSSSVESLLFIVIKKTSKMLLIANLCGFVNKQ